MLRKVQRLPLNISILIVACSVVSIRTENIGTTKPPPAHTYDMSIFERDGHEAVVAQTDQCFAFQYKQYYWNKAGGTEV